jgi:dTDP-4-dehydrorhamnose reductase
MRILVLGSQGMLGQAVAKVLTDAGMEVAGTQFVDRSASNYLDAAAGRASWDALFAAARCEYAVNCIGILSAAIRESDAASMERAIRVNSLFPYELAAAAAERGARVIQISTDAVFSGREEPYVETDPPDPADHYGRTKLLGECPAGNFLNIRCSIVGRDAVGHKGILEWYLSRPEASEIDGYEDRRWNGVTTVQFAGLCARVIAGGAFDRLRAISHVHHFCPNPVTTKYGLLRAWQEVTGRRTRVRPASSPRPGGRVLGTVYNGLGALYPAAGDWRAILSDLRG